MPLPPLYKYLSFEGAKLTLGNGTFRHAKPSDFNDDMDMTLQSVFPEDIETALEQITNGMARIISENLDKPPTCSAGKMRVMVSQLQDMLRAKPELLEIFEREMVGERIGDVYDVEHMRNYTENLVAELNEFLQGFRVLCVTDDKASIPMWERYTANHCGVVLRITPNEEKDSIFKLFRKVTYERVRPTLYENATAFLEGSLFGDQQRTKREMLDKIIYTKTLEWEFEQEYRLSAPLAPGENYDTLRYHPEEVSELYLGANMKLIEKEEVVELARSRNAGVEIFQASFNDHGKIVFDEAW